MMPPTSIDGTDITGATIDGQDVEEITVDGQTVFSAVGVPNTAIHRYTAQNSGFSNNQTVSTWSDEIGNVDLSAEGSPTLNSSGINGLPAVDFDGNDDALNNPSGYPSLPSTIVLVMFYDDANARQTLFYDTDENRDFEVIFPDQNPDQLFLNYDDTSGGSTANRVFAPTGGEQLITIAADSTSIEIRTNRVQRISLPTFDSTLFQSGAIFYDPRPRRFADAKCAELVVHNTKLTGAALTDEENRLANLYNLSV